MPLYTAIVKLIPVRQLVGTYMGREGHSRCRPVPYVALPPVCPPLAWDDILQLWHVHNEKMQQLPGHTQKVLACQLWCSVTPSRCVRPGLND